MTEGQAQGQPTPEAAPAEAQAPEGYVPQKQVNKIVGERAKEAEQRTISKLLEQTGAESMDDVLAAYSEYSEIREAVESESDRANQKAERAEKKAKEAQANYENTLKTYAVRDALRDAGANPARLAALMRIGDLSALEVDAEGNVAGVEDFVEAAREQAPEFFPESAAGPGPARVSAPQTNGLDASLARPQASPEEQHAQWLLDIFRQQSP